MDKETRRRRGENSNLFMPGSDGGPNQLTFPADGIKNKKIKERREEYTRIPSSGRRHSRERVITNSIIDHGNYEERPVIRWLPLLLPPSFTN